MAHLGRSPEATRPGLKIDETSPRRGLETAEDYVGGIPRVVPDASLSTGSPDNNDVRFRKGLAFGVSVATLFWVCVTVWLLMHWGLL